MTDINIYTSITQSITNDVALFKNNEKNITELNKDMIIKMCLLLNLSKEVEEKNEKIVKEQNIEIERILKLEEKKKQKIQTEQKNKKEIDESSDEENNEEEYSLNLLINPTLQIYIPMNQTSFSLEDNVLVDLKGKLIIDDNLINQKKEINEENDNIIFDLSFEEPVILSNIKKSENKIENNLIFNEKNIDNIELRDNLNLSDLNSNEPIIFLNDKNKNEISFIPHKRAFTICFKQTQNTLDKGINSQRSTESNSIISVNNIYESEFKNHLSNKIFDYYNKQMHITYLRRLLDIYLQIKNKSNSASFCEERMFLNLTKIYLLKIGISDKKIYEDTLRNLVYKGEKCDFESFLNCFLKILKLEEENLIIKYKFLMYLISEKDEVTLNQLKKYCNELIRSKLIYDEDIYNEIRTKIINKYNSLYKGEYQVFSLRNILLVLESIFENK